MKIEEKDGKRVVIFENGIDDELKANFMAEIEKERHLVNAANSAVEEHDAVCKRMKVAIKKLELYRLEHHDEIWDPVTEAVNQALGADGDIGLSFNYETGELTIMDKRNVPSAHGIPPQLMGLIASLTGKSDCDDNPEEDDDKIVH